MKRLGYLNARLWGIPHFSPLGKPFWVQYRVVRGLQELLVNEYLLTDLDDPVNIAGLFRGIPRSLSDNEPRKFPYLIPKVKLSNERFASLLSRAIHECERRIHENFLSFKERLMVVWKGAKLYEKTVKKSETEVALYLLRNYIGDPSSVSLGGEIFIPLSINEDFVYDLISGQEDRAISLLMKRDPRIRSVLLSVL